MSTTTTHEKTQAVQLLEQRLSGFRSWLTSVPIKAFTLSMVAKQICEMFPIEYCSIHITGQGKWHNRSGNWASPSLLEIPDSLKNREDHPFGAFELAEEQMLNVRNFPIRCGHETVGVLVVKGDSLTNEAGNSIAMIIGKFLILNLASWRLGGLSS